MRDTTPLEQTEPFNLGGSLWVPCFETCYYALSSAHASRHDSTQLPQMVALYLLLWLSAQWLSSIQSANVIRVLTVKQHRSPLRLSKLSLSLLVVSLHR